MARKNLTEIFPFLLPLRQWQRKQFFYLKMKYDSHTYALNKAKDTWQYRIATKSSNLYNYETGFDFIYQENKVFNLKLASKKLDGLLIYPGEVFSFWQVIQGADKCVRYKEGLVVNNGKLMTEYGGGICHLSNLLFPLFLETPLTVVERHGHRIKSFNHPDGIALEGLDATVAEGWLDLKFANETNNVYQLSITFDDEQIHGKLTASHPTKVKYEITNGLPMYTQIDETLFEHIPVNRATIDCEHGHIIKTEELYTNTTALVPHLAKSLQQREDFYIYEKTTN